MRLIGWPKRVQARKYARRLAYAHAVTYELNKHVCDDWFMVVNYDIMRPGLPA